MTSVLPRGRITACCVWDGQVAVLVNLLGHCTSSDLVWSPDRWELAKDAVCTTNVIDGNHQKGLTPYTPPNPNTQYLFKLWFHSDRKCVTSDSLTYMCTVIYRVTYVHNRRTAINDNHKFMGHILFMLLYPICLIM